MADVTREDTATLVSPTHVSESPSPSRVSIRFVRLIIPALCLITVGVIVASALFAPLIAPFDPLEQDFRERSVPPSRSHLLGTDDFGRDVFSRVVWGLRPTLTIVVITVLLAGSVGTYAGIFSAYQGGAMDMIVNRVASVLMSLPIMLLGLIVLAILGPGTKNVIIAATIALLAGYVRLARSRTLVLRETEFVTAAEALGASGMRVVLKHMFPNMRNELLVFSLVYSADLVAIEGAFSFIGIGIQPPTPSLGLMIREGFRWVGYANWLVIAPGGVLLAFVLALNLLADRLGMPGRRA